MDKDLKINIKNEINRIINEIEYEEYCFNKIFRNNLSFQKSYYKFNIIYEKYGKEAYLKYVPFKYKKQELKDLILQRNFLCIYEHYGLSTLQKLEYSANLTTTELQTKSTFKLLLIRLKKLFSSKFISLPSHTILALPEKISINYKKYWFFYKNML